MYEHFCSPPPPLEKILGAPLAVQDTEQNGQWVQCQIRDHRIAASARDTSWSRHPAGRDSVSLPVTPSLVTLSQRSDSHPTPLHRHIQTVPQPRLIRPCRYTGAVSVCGRRAAVRSERAATPCPAPTMPGRFSCSFVVDNAPSWP